MEHTLPTTVFPGRARFFFLGILFLASLADAQISSALTFGRFGMMGALQTSADAFAGLEVAYIIAKYLGFILAPWLATQRDSVDWLHTLCLCLCLSSLGFLCIHDVSLLVALRFVQGLAGGSLLVLGQFMLFQAFPSRQQPAVQACFALGAMVAPGMLVPSVQGLMVDQASWHWILYSAASLSLLASVALLFSPRPPAPSPQAKPLDLRGLALFMTSVSSLSYISQRGSRWNWFQDQDILAAALIGLVASVLFLRRQRRASQPLLIDNAVFQRPDTCFGFIICLTVAGGVLFCSNALISGLSFSVLAFSPTVAGQMHLPAGLAFIAALFFAAFLMQRRQLPTLTTVPMGVLLILTSMWLLSKASCDSSAVDLLPGLLARGAGLGCLFLPVTILTLNGLPREINLQAVALFQVIRQTGGLFFVALLQYALDQYAAVSRFVLASHLETGAPLLLSRLHTATDLLRDQGMEGLQATQAAVGLLKKSMEIQAASLSIENGFLTVMIGLLCCVPCLASFKFYLSTAHSAHKE